MTTNSGPLIVLALLSDTMHLFKTLQDERSICVERILARMLGTKHSKRAFFRGGALKRDHFSGFLGLEVEGAQKSCQKWSRGIPYPSKRGSLNQIWSKSQVPDVPWPLPDKCGNNRNDAMWFKKLSCVTRRDLFGIFSLLSASFDKFLLLKTKVGSLFDRATIDHTRPGSSQAHRKFGKLLDVFRGKKVTGRTCPPKPETAG